jgi:cyanophycin synthetase
MNDIRVVRSGISVYEVEVDLGRYSLVDTSEIAGFTRKLLRRLPTLRQHECYAGEVGGFVKELERGTDLAHVMEHVILELLKLASRSRRCFSGWTRKKVKNHVIHFQAPDARSAREATLGAIGLIEGVIAGRPVDAREVVASIRRNGRDDGRSTRHRTAGAAATARRARGPAGRRRKPKGGLK